MDFIDSDLPQPEVFSPETMDQLHEAAMILVQLDLDGFIENMAFIQERIGAASAETVSNNLALARAALHLYREAFSQLDSQRAAEVKADFQRRCLVGRVGKKLAQEMSDRLRELGMSGEVRFAGLGSFKEEDDDNEDG